MLKTKCILYKKEKSDGLRISIMSRHTLYDGVTSDDRITDKSFDKWQLDFAPPTKLLGDYYKRNLPWDKFEKRYIEYLNSIQDKIKNLAIDALKKDITLLCIEETPEKCHRKLLAKECKKIVPELEMIIK